MSFRRLRIGLLMVALLAALSLPVGAVWGADKPPGGGTNDQSPSGDSSNPPPGEAPQIHYRGVDTPPPSPPLPLLRTIRVPGTYVNATYLTAPPGDRSRLFILQQAGLIRIVRDGHPLARPFLDLRRFVTTGRAEQGLLSLAFAPDYATSGKFYVFYTGKDSNDRLIEYRRATADRADPHGRLVLFNRKQRSNHHGGLLVFGPRDHLLYVGLGDDGAANAVNGQLLNTIKGKIIRIDPRPLPGVRGYHIPRSNPFVGRAGVRPEIYAYGLRNPWRYTIDPVSGAIVIADAGEGDQEEVDYEARGQAAAKNFGWPVFEGFTHHTDRGADPPNPEEPVFSYENEKGCSAIIGGYVVRDRSLGPEYYGRYLYSDYCHGVVHSLRVGPGDASGDTPAVGRPLYLTSSFGRDAAGHIYVMQQNGSVWRLAR